MNKRTKASLSSGRIREYGKDQSCVYTHVWDEENKEKKRIRSRRIRRVVAVYCKIGPNIFRMASKAHATREGTSLATSRCNVVQGGGGGGGGGGRSSSVWSELERER
ncbi:hypothetical protein PV325_009763 [Microctonus aethiopoides]|nr:hypothetical protein PV325_009763 [Microctonus aethiopoides]